MVDVEGVEVIGPLRVASVAIGALGAGFFLDLLVPGKTWRRQERAYIQCEKQLGVLVFFVHSVILHHNEEY